MALGGAVVLFVVGCGGNVVVDGSGGAGGSGGSGGTTSTSSLTPSTGTSIQPGDYCQSACDQLVEHGCLEADGLSACIQGCIDVFNEYPQCASEIVAVYDCVVGSLVGEGCGGSDVDCNSKQFKYEKCIAGPMECVEAGCASGSGVCSCQGTCEGKELEAICEDGPSGVQCTCLINGEVVGICEDQELSCAVLDGCCSDYYFFN